MRLWRQFDSWETYSVTMRQDKGSFSRISAIYPLIRILRSSPRILCDLFTIVPFSRLLENRVWLQTSNGWRVGRWEEDKRGSRGSRGVFWLPSLAAQSRDRSGWRLSLITWYRGHSSLQEFAPVCSHGRTSSQCPNKLPRGLEGLLNARPI